MQPAVFSVETVAIAVSSDLNPVSIAISDDQKIRCEALWLQPSTTMWHLAFVNFKDFNKMS